MKPTAFLPWQQQVWSQLEVVYPLDQAHKWPNALLLLGPVGGGKMALCEQVSKALLCDSEHQIHLSQGGCGQCANCRLNASDSHPDTLKVVSDTGKESIKINEIRELKSATMLIPQVGKARVVIIGPLEKLTEGAANALLKCLEEPPERTHFLLFSHELTQVKMTLRSRSRLMQCQMPTFTQVCDWLTSQDYQFNDKDIRLLSDWFAGAPLRIKQALDANHLDQLKSWSKLLASMANKNGLEAILAIQEWSDIDAIYLLSWTQLWLKGFIKNRLLSLSSTDAKYLDENADVKRRSLSRFFELADWVKTQQRLLTITPQLNQQRLLENLVIRWREVLIETAT